MLMLSIILLLSSTAVTTRRDKSILYARSVITILVVCLLISLNSHYISFQDKGLGIFHGLFHTTAITNAFHIFIFIICALILQINSFYPRKIWSESYCSPMKILLHKLVCYNSQIINKMSEQFKILEYPLIILFIIIGGIFLISSSDLMSVFLSIELQSYGLYILCCVYKNSEKATSAALTYFLLGGLSSCFILLAFSLLYAGSGNTAFDGLYIINNIGNINHVFENVENTYSSWYQSYYINFSLVIMSVGFLFKITAAPFHFWSPDVYDAIPTVVTTFVAIFAKISIFILLLELVHYTSDLVSQYEIKSLNNVSNYTWTYSLLISSLFSLVIGSVLGLTQFRIKRLYAYSTISHIGFILLSLTINSMESMQSFMFYLMQYSLANLNAFIILIAMGFSLYIYMDNKNVDYNKTANETEEIADVHLTVSDKLNSPLQLISQIKGYFYINSMLSISLAITIFSFAGIPPLVGFFAKQMVLSSALDSGYIFMSLIAVLTSVISAYYYLALIKQMFFNKSDYILNPQFNSLQIKGKIVGQIGNYNKDISLYVNNISLSSYLSITISILTLVILLFMLNPQEWLSMANILAIVLFNN